MAISRETNNTDRQSLYYNAKFHQPIEKYLFKDIGFAEHLQSTHWHRLFHHYLQDVRGQRVLEIGCGTGWISLLLAQRGAQVTSVDISAREIEVLWLNAEHYGFADCICALAGDITQMDLPAESFDLCVGGSFLHHLEHKEEAPLLRELHRLLIPGGMALFVEPAVNSKLLDRIRYLVPTVDRPACWSRSWAAYRARDPHPERDNSCRHFRRLGEQLFGWAEVEPIGVFNRLERLTGYRGKRLIHRTDELVFGHLPRVVREPFCRAQIICFRKSVES